jgi:hypothetical protein
MLGSTLQLSVRVKGLWMNNILEQDERIIHEAIEAAKNGSWEQFAKLSNEGFVNPETMREQFLHSSALVKASNGDIRIEAISVDDPVEYGERLVTARLHFSEKMSPIIMLLHSEDVGGKFEYGIWAFYQEISWMEG